MLNYKMITDQLNRHLASRYLDIENIELFEHAFLRLMGCQFIPEKCRVYYTNTNDNNLYILFKEPYNITVYDFINDLKRCAAGEFSEVSVQEVFADLNKRNFCAHIKIPYQLIENYMPKILEMIDLILLDPLKMNFYKHCHNYINKHDYYLTSINIKRLLNSQLTNYPYADLPEIWSAIAKKNDGLDKNTELTFLQEEIALDIDNFPKITILLQTKEGGVKKIELTRQQIVTTLSNPYSLDKFLTYDKSKQEFLISAIKGKYSNISFYFNIAGHYEIDFGYLYKKIIGLEKFGIEASSYRIFYSSTKNIRYIFSDKENFMRSLLALKEINGERCFQERLHQLSYYVHNNKWEKLKNALNFFLNFKEETTIATDYTGLGLCLFDIAKDLCGESQEKTFQIIFEAFEKLINTNKVKVIHQKMIHTALFEMYLMKMNDLSKSGSKAERLALQKKLFLHSQQAGLEESNLYLAELAGLTFGNTLKSDVTQDPLAVILELATHHKEINEKSEQLAHTNKASYFGAIFNRK